LLLAAVVADLRMTVLLQMLAVLVDSLIDTPQTRCNSVHQLSKSRWVLEVLAVGQMRQELRVVNGK
jgi:hypothetical protein